MLDPNGIEVERLDRKDCIANFILRPNIIFYAPTSNLEQQKRVKLLAFTRPISDGKGLLFNERPVAASKQDRHVVGIAIACRKVDQSITIKVTRGDRNWTIAHRES